MLSDMVQFHTLVTTFFSKPTVVIRYGSQAQFVFRSNVDVEHQFYVFSDYMAFCAYTEAMTNMARCACITACGQMYPL